MANDAYAYLDKLYSLVEIPKFGDTTSPARFFHSSLANYLVNREYSQEFWIDVKDVVADLWQCHFHVLLETQVSGMQESLANSYLRYILLCRSFDSPTVSDPTRLAFDIS